jgi:hypothetical protein
MHQTAFLAGVITGQHLCDRASAGTVAAPWMKSAFTKTRLLRLPEVSAPGCASLSVSATSQASRGADRVTDLETAFLGGPAPCTLENAECGATFLLAYWRSHPDVGHLLNAERNGQFPRLMRTFATCRRAPS